MPTHDPQFEGSNPATAGIERNCQKEFESSFYPKPIQNSKCLVAEKILALGQSHRHHMVVVTCSWSTIFFGKK